MAEVCWGLWSSLLGEKRLLRVCVSDGKGAGPEDWVAAREFFLEVVFFERA